MCKLRGTAFLLFFSFQFANAQWQQTTGPAGAYAQFIEVNGSTLLMGTLEPGLFKSDDSGLTWRLVYPDLQSSTTLYSGCWDFTKDGNAYFVGTGDGVQKSTDDGEHWTNSGLSNSLVKAITCFEGKIFAGDYGGISVSDDSGTTWNPIPQSGQYISDFLISHGRILASTSCCGLLVSDDTGATWNWRNNGFNNLTLSRFDVAGYRILITSQDGAYYSDDNGNTWVQTFTLTNLDFVFAHNNDVILSGNGQLYFSADSGNTFQPVSMGVGHHLRSLSFSGGTLYAATVAGPFQSTDWGMTWQSLSGNGLLGVTVRSLLSAGGRVYAATQGQGLYASSDQCNSWTEVPHAYRAENFCYKLIQDDSLCYLANGLDVFRSANYGISWSRLNTSFQAYTINGLAADKNLLLISNHSNGGHVYLSTDTGVTFTDRSNGLPPGGATVLLIDSGVFFAGPGAFQGVYKSVDSGNTWLAASGDIAQTNVQDFVKCGNSIFAATNHGLFRSNDGGNTWSCIQVGSLSLNSYFQCLLNKDGNLFAGMMPQGVYYSADTGLTWSPLNAGLPAGPWVLSLAADANYLYASFKSNSVWRFPFSFPTITPEVDVSSHSIVVFPDPAYDHIYVSFPEDEFRIIQFEIFSMEGKKVLELKNPQSTEIPVGSLEAGIYFLKVQGEECTITKKFALGGN